MTCWPVCRPKSAKLGCGDWNCWRLRPYSKSSRNKSSLKEVNYEMGSHHSNFAGRAGPGRLGDRVTASQRTLRGAHTSYEAIAGSCVGCNYGLSIYACVALQRVQGGAPG